MFSPHCVFDERSEEGMKEVNDNFVVGLWDPGSLICQYLTQAYQKTFNRAPEKQTFSCSFEILAAFPQPM